MTFPHRFAALACLSLCLPGLMPAGGRLAANSGPELQMTLRLYNYAELDREILENAHTEIARIFSHVGIGVSWLNCAISLEEAQSNRACAIQPGAADLVVRILPRAMHPSVSGRSKTFGYALIGPKILTPRFAGVLFENVERLAEGRRARMDYSVVHRSFTDEIFVGRLLGYVIAHEVGHLLLNSSKHAAGGIMRAKWDVNVTARALTRRLRFEPREVKRIRAELERRDAVTRPRLASNS